MEWNSLIKVPQIQAIFTANKLDPNNPAQSANVLRQVLTPFKPIINQSQQLFPNLKDLTQEQANQIFTDIKELQDSESRISSLYTAVVLPLLTSQPIATQTSSLLGSQYAELQFNLQQLDLSLQRKGGVFTDLSSQYLNNNTTKITQPYLTLGYHIKPTENVNVGLFTNLSYNNKTQPKNNTSPTKDKVIGLGLYTNYQHNNLILSALGNINRHHITVKNIDTINNTPETPYQYNVITQSASYHTKSIDLTLKAAYQYQFNQQLTFTPSISYQYGKTDGTDVKVNSYLDYRLPDIEVHLAGLNLLTEYKFNDWNIGLDLGVSYVNTHGVPLYYSEVLKTVTVRSASTDGSLAPNQKTFIIPEDVSSQNTFKEYKLSSKLSIEKTLSKQSHIGALLGYNHYTKTKFHGLNWGINYRFEF
ncbi:autotransporter outer membrane beta-barrel domain-containing protein [Gallibacterium genomosp. 3]|uniref:autotransporter outer membrane beta-barrel domain-containing protein n=1 Tax=Gallibacterium genomosp. 3 TaxID=505345 RepID=UPI0009F1853C